MNIFDRMQQFIDSLEERTFYIYMTGTIAGITALALLILFHYYSRAGTLQETIDSINDQRTKVKRILTTYAQVKKHKAEVDALMAANEGFKIGGYYKELLARLGLANKHVMQTPSHIDHEKYRETVLKAQLTDMNMKQLCELLAALDQNKLVYLKELEITKAKQAQRAIEVALTIAALEPLAAATA